MIHHAQTVRSHVRIEIFTDTSSRYKRRRTYGEINEIIIRQHSSIHLYVITVITKLQDNVFDTSAAVALNVCRGVGKIYVCDHPVHVAVVWLITSRNVCSISLIFFFFFFTITPNFFDKYAAVYVCIPSVAFSHGNLANVMFCLEVSCRFVYHFKTKVTGFL